MFKHLEKAKPARANLASCVGGANHAASSVCRLVGNVEATSQVVTSRPWIQPKPRLKAKEHNKLARQTKKGRCRGEEHREIQG